MNCCKGFKIRNTMLAERIRRLVAPDGGSVDDSVLTRGLDEAGLDIHWIRIFHREVRDRFRGRGLMTLEDEVKEEFSIVLVNLNPSARIGGAARVAVCWSEFEKYMVEKGRRGEDEAPVMIVLYPADLFETWMTATEMFPLSHHSCNQRSRVDKFMKMMGYERKQADAPLNAWLFVFESVAEVAEEDMLTNVMEMERDLRRKLLVHGIRAFHSADMAWRIPALVTIRTGDSPDGMGYDGQAVVVMRQWGRVIQWTREDHDDDYVEQEFDVETGKRRMPRYWWLEQYLPEARPTRVAWVGFPPHFG